MASFKRKPKKKSHRESFPKAKILEISLSQFRKKTFVNQINDAITSAILFVGLIVAINGSVTMFEVRNTFVAFATTKWFKYVLILFFRRLGQSVQLTGTCSVHIRDSLFRQSCQSSLGIHCNGHQSQCSLCFHIGIRSRNKLLHRLLQNFVWADFCQN